MATSGTFTSGRYGGGTNGPWLSLAWKQVSQSVANNSTTLDLTLTFHWSGNINYTFYSRTGSVQGHSYTYSGSASGTSGSRTLKTQRVTITHNSNGAKSVTLSGNITNLGLSWSSVNVGTMSVSGVANLETIPRGSTLSAFSFASSLQVGTANTINYTVTRHSSSFRHQLQLRDGSVTVAQWDNVSSNGSDTLSLTGTQVNTILGRMSTVTSKTFTLRLSTRSGVNGGWIGSSVTRDASVSVNANVEPQIISTSATPIGNSWAVGKGFYVQGQTGVQADFSSNARGGAGVKSRNISIGSLSSGGAVVGSVFRHSLSRVNSTGNITITYKITDTRNRTVSSTRTINFRAYTPPRITSFTVGRSSPTSTTVNIKSQGSIHGMGGQNTGTMTVTQQGVSGNVRSQSLNNTTPSFNDSFNRTVVTSVSADFTITVTDSLGNRATSTSTVGTAFMEFSIRKGTGVGIGKVHEFGVLDVDGPASFGHTDFDIEGQVPVIMRILSSDERTGLIQGRDAADVVSWQIGNRMKNARALYLEAFDANGIRMNATNVRINNDIIADSGSNTNGHWVRFYDGTQICWIRKDFASSVMSTRTDTAQGLTVYGARHDWTFPNAFSVSPSVSVSGDEQNYGRMETVTAWGITTAQVTVGWESLVAKGSVSFRANYIAIGRWK